MTLSTSLEHLTKLAQAPSPTPPELQQAIYTVVKQTEGATQEDIETALLQMNLLVSQVALLPAALIAMGCGALIEQGTDPEIASTAILQRTKEAFKLASAFGLACQIEARKTHISHENDPSTVQECVEKYGQSVSREMPEEASAWLALEPISTAALAVLMRSPQDREAACNDAEFMATINELAHNHSPAVECLYDLLHVLDEDVIVLHPALRRGYRIHIRSIGNNFQLHTLLADTLIGDQEQGWLPGERPDPRVAAAAKDGPFPMPGDDTTDFPVAVGAFNLWNWQGLQPDGTLPTGYDKREHWIWNEGKPTDITFFEGIRVILLGPPPYPRTWSAGRYFPGLKGEMEVLEVLSQAQVNDWLTRIVTAVKHSE